MKFGGTSVGDVAAFERVIGVVSSQIERQPVVVVSAMTKVTDALNRTTTFGYNNAGQPTSAKNGLDHTTRLTYELGDLALEYVEVVTRRLCRLAHGVDIGARLGNVRRRLVHGLAHLHWYASSDLGV